LHTNGQKQAFITVAEKEETVVGYCIIYHVMDEAEIARIAVLDECRQLGVGQGLLGYTMDLCKELQITRMLLDVRESNITARNFYVKNGFAEDGVRKNFYENPKEHAVLMSRGL
jgi:ribosomal-protein-alanine N-acetyltransferase